MAMSDLFKEFEDLIDQGFEDLLYFVREIEGRTRTKDFKQKYLVVVIPLVPLVVPVVQRRAIALKRIHLGDRLLEPLILPPVPLLTGLLSPHLPPTVLYKGWVGYQKFLEN
ncbi:MAG: hypothetical protein HC840_16820 [Leptolyngbyaceae cyanobacterium RM2_2_4]|nr:hypothetical protein [Leptolyngbyaceae cyanobacterium RM2_2_4]